jgi:hypothetical protein
MSRLLEGGYTARHGLLHRIFRPEPSLSSSPFITSGPIPFEPSLKEKDQAQSLLDQWNSERQLQLVCSGKLSPESYQLTMLLHSGQSTHLVSQNSIVPWAIFRPEPSLSSSPFITSGPIPFEPSFGDGTEA